MTRICRPGWSICLLISIRTPAKPFFLGLDHVSDEELWIYAYQHGYTIVTKDADFNEMCIVRGFPPKVILLQMGNCTTNQIKVTLQIHFQTIMDWSLDPVNGILKLA